MKLKLSEDPESVERVRVALSDLDACHDEGRALAVLLTAALDSGESYQHVAAGVQSLFWRIEDDITETMIELRTKLFGSTQDETDTEPAAVAAEPAKPSESAVATRERLVAILAAEGRPAGDIAQALNMRKTAVEAMIGRLVGEQLPNPLPKRHRMPTLREALANG